MKLLTCTVFIVLNIFLSGLSGQTNEKLTLSDIYDSDKFTGESLEKAKWLPDSKGFTFFKEDKDSGIISIYVHDIKSGQEKLLFDGKQISDAQTKETLILDDYGISKSGNKLLLKADARRVWRRYSEARYFVYDREKDKLISISGSNDYIRHAKLSADEKQVGYVFQNNIYLKNMNSGRTSKVTTDGSDVIINGQFDWVYEEEFGQDDGWRWSPDGKKIAFWRLDQAAIPNFSWTEYDAKYGEVRTIHYPKAGEQNALVQIGIYDLDKKLTVWLDLGPEQDIYIPRIQWTGDSNTLAVQRLNRLQNNLDLIFYDAQTGSGQVVLNEQDPCWVDIHDNLTFLNKKKQFIWTSERDGFNHIYLYRNNGKFLKQLTGGPWEVREVLAVNEAGGSVLFSANKTKTEEKHNYSVSLDGGNIRKISKFSGWNSADFSPDASYFIHTYSSVAQPDKVDLVSVDAGKIRPLVENRLPELEKYQLAYPEFIQFKTSDGAAIHAQITKPVDFDPAKKYPVLVYGYGGPGSQLVLNRWGRMTSRLWYALLAQKDYIIFTIDNRGSGGKGKAYKNLAYGDIGKYMVIDHIEGAKYLSGLPYIDKNRIGIWGWSGGGYLTLLCMTRGAEYFKAGVAVAPVSDYHLYDSIWTERYMGLPQSNAAGYKAASALTYVDEYRDGLLIIHGMADDNVHAQNSMQFVEQLQLKNKPFQMMVYPQKNHSMLGGQPVYLHLYTLITNYILNNL